MLVAEGDVEDCAAAGNVEPSITPVQHLVLVGETTRRDCVHDSLVTVGHEEVRIQLPEIELYMADSMCRIDQTQYAPLPTQLGEAFKGQPHTRHADDRVEHGDLYLAASFLDLVNLGREGGDEPIVLDGEGVADLCSLGGRRLGDERHGLFAGTVYRGRVEYVLVGFEDQVVKDGVDSRGSIGNEDEFFGGDVEVLEVSDTRWSRDGGNLSKTWQSMVEEVGTFDNSSRASSLRFGYS